MSVARIFLFLFLIPFFSHASVIINEIMYDLEGSDTDREWIEIFNDGNTPIDLTGWKFFEADTNHALNLSKGEIILQPNDYAVIADNADKFLIDWPNFSGTLFDSSFSLSNTGETLTMRNADLVDMDTITYSSDWGANGDGKSVQKVGSQWLVGNPTPGLQNTSQQSTQNQQSQTQENQNSAFPVEEEQISANAGNDQTGIVGAEIKFSGRAFGLNKEPLENARYLWTFGDGAKAEGKNVLHIFQYPGDYIVVLNVSSGKYSASDRITLKLLANSLKIIDANENYITLKNDSNNIIDISNWFLRCNNQTFKFPETTLIKGDSNLQISSSISGIKTGDNQKIELLYPNSSVASSFIITLKKSMPILGDQNIISEPVQEKQNIQPPVLTEEYKDNSDNDNNQENQQVAGIIETLPKEVSSSKNWMILILILGAVGGLGLIFIKRSI
ncbi:MAG: lamin tail domain-containing protein [Patescibacteria group bacterium]